MTTLYEAARAFLAAEKAFQSTVMEPTAHWASLERQYRQVRYELQDALDRHASAKVQRLIA